MKITFIPIEAGYPHKQGDLRYAFLHREDEAPKIIMRNVETSRSANIGSSDRSVWISGDPVNGFDFTQLQDNDQIIYPSSRAVNDILVTSLKATEFILAPFEADHTMSSIAAGLETGPSVLVTLTEEVKETAKQAIQVASSASDLYKKLPMYSTIMMKDNGETKSHTLLSLVAAQEPELRAKLEVYLLSMRSSFMTSRHKEASAQKILNEIPFDEHFLLLTEEEQVGHFIEFSRISSASKKEHVPDSLIELIKASDEYSSTLDTITEYGFGESVTQQFNVLQQIGYFSSNHRHRNVLYNLSDMGAGKTLMTVQAIAALDKKQISTWLSSHGHDESILFRVPDKHIITPTLSVTSSWIDTFKIFYDVEVISDFQYKLTMDYKGQTIESFIYVAPFTIRNSLMFVPKKLPYTDNNTYLIIDEIHQLVKKPMPRTKFFPPQTSPSSIYKTFVLSGTMSNLLTQEWLNYLRFMDLQVSHLTPQQATAEIKDLQRQMAVSLRSSLDDIRTVHKRGIDTADFTEANTFDIESAKMTSINELFFTQYSTLIAKFPSFYNRESISYEEFITGIAEKDYSLYVNPDESDTTNFKLFYDIVGPQSITAQSTTVAEELFGDQQQQHLSDIIKTKSPLTSEDITILKTLHHIAEDHDKYKSVRIAKLINTAILNLNDGLQTKNIYDIVSSAAENNIRFFEYLTTLDLNVLERLPQSNLISLPKLEETEKFQILQDILEREQDETHLIVVNDYHAMRRLSEALGVTSITRAQLRDELAYQDTLNELFEQQSIVVVTQDMIKSSLDLVQANRLVQYQLNTEISDIIQTQNRINRIGQTRETRGYYIASDALQENLIELFLNSYRNIRVAHKGIVELFVDVTSQINIINNYLTKAFENIETDVNGEDEITMTQSDDIFDIAEIEDISTIKSEGGIAAAVLMPDENGEVSIIVPLTDEDNTPFVLGRLSLAKTTEHNVIAPIIAEVNLETMEVVL